MEYRTVDQDSLAELAKQVDESGPTAKANCLARLAIAERLGIIAEILREHQ